MAKFQINEETDFTPAKLRDFLQQKHGGKKNGSDFNNQDIQQYTMRGRLPEEYGGHRIEVIDHPDYRIKILRIKDLTNGSK